MLLQSLEQALVYRCCLQHVLNDFISVQLRVETTILPLYAFEPTIRKYQVITFRKIEVGLLCKNFCVKQLLNDRAWLLLLADHKEYCHHESHLMPEEG